MTTILITGAGGAAAISLLKSFATRPGLRLVAGDIDPNAAGLYVDGVAARVRLRRGDDSAFVVDLLEQCLDHGVNVVVPTVGAELEALADARPAFEAHGIRVLLAAREPVATCLDKWSFYLALRGRLAVPETALVNGALLATGTFPDSGEPIAFPAIVKPRRGAGSDGVRMVHSLDDLATTPTDGQWLLQRLLPGEEYSVDVLADRRGQPLIGVPRLRMKVDSGVAVAARTVKDDALIDLAMATVRELGLAYVANVQMRRNPKGEPELLEVNPRFPGTMPLTVAAGVPMPMLALDLCLGSPVEVPTTFDEVAVVRWLQETMVDPATLRAPFAAPSARRIAS